MPCSQLSTKFNGKRYLPILSDVHKYEGNEFNIIPGLNLVNARPSNDQPERDSCFKEIVPADGRPSRFLSAWFE